jgi:serine/threonine protein kinase
VLTLGRPECPDADLAPAARLDRESARWARLATSMPTEPTPSRFGQYELLDLIGEGGMGRVWRARGPDGTIVALKIVKEELAGDAVFRKRFAREARAGSHVDHPRVAPLLEVGEVDGIPFLAQPYVSGGSLDDRLKRDGRLPPEAAVRVIRQIAAGLDALHAAGFVHRDLKPANVLLDDEGHAVLTDFGLAKEQQASVLTKVGQAVGSMDYMAPEQIRGLTVGPTTDVYAMGCLLYELLIGEPPFAAKRGMQVLWAHLQEPPPPLPAGEVPGELAQAVMFALEKEPERRPPTATAYARMLQAAAQQTSPRGAG